LRVRGTPTTCLRTSSSATYWRWLITLMWVAMYGGICCGLASSARRPRLYTLNNESGLLITEISRWMARQTEGVCEPFIRVPNCMRGPNFRHSHVWGVPGRRLVPGHRLAMLAPPKCVERLSREQMASLGLPYDDYADTLVESLTESAALSKILLHSTTSRLGSSTVGYVILPR
jgi:hypothetical protein